LNGAVARRYAVALADVALEQKKAEAFKSELAEFVEVFYGSADLRHFLDNPSIDPKLKREATDKIASAMGLSTSIRNFALIVVDHQRTAMLREIERAFRDELNSRLGIAQAEVVSARELSQAEKRELVEALERRTGKKISANFQRDESLLGGAVVRVGSTVYDGSVKEQLERLREQLAGE
jgi:F-type H+-transporting ATPase subunit delta